MSKADTNCIPNTNFQWNLNLDEPLPPNYREFKANILKFQAEMCKSHAPSFVNGTKSDTGNSQSGAINNAYYIASSWTTIDGVTHHHLHSSLYNWAVGLAVIFCILGLLWICRVPLMACLGQLCSFCWIRAITQPQLPTGAYQADMAPISVPPRTQVAQKIPPNNKNTTLII